MKTQHLALALCVALIWALNVIFMKFAMQEIPPLFFTLLRMLVVFPILLFVRPQYLPWHYMFPISIFWGIGHYVLIGVGINFGMGAGITTLILQLNPFFSILFAMLLLKETPRFFQLLGMLLAFYGIYVLSSSQDTNVTLYGLLSISTSAACMGMSNVLIKKMQKSFPTTDSLSLPIWIFLYTTPFLFALSIYFEGKDVMLSSLMNASPRSFIVILFSGWVSMIVAMKLWGFLLATYPVSMVAPFSMFAPVFSLLISFFLLGENLTSNGSTALILVFSGLIINQFSSKIIKFIHIFAFKFFNIMLNIKIKLK
ncbi:MAG: EamA family transporter [Silvanigrellaceae bacterium]|nr:EamA family transporter [Silvanigrellaceae bacterium]